MGESVKIGDKISMDVIVRPPWWAFWRKPERVRRNYIVTRTTTPDEAADDTLSEWPNVSQVRLTD